MHSNRYEKTSAVQTLKTARYTLWEKSSEPD